MVILSRNIVLILNIGKFTNKLDFYGTFYCLTVLRSNSCKKCNAYYWNLKRLRSHHKECKQVQNKLSLCDFCGKGFTTKTNLQVHRQIHGSGSKLVFECFMCKRQFQSKKSLKQHILQKHVDDKPKFQCDACGKRIMWRSRFVRHLKLHSNNFPFECSHCSKKFRFKDKLTVSS